MKRSGHMRRGYRRHAVGGMLCGLREPQAIEACTPLPDGQPRPVAQAPYRSGMRLMGIWPNGMASLSRK